MRVWIVPQDGKGIADLRCIERPDPKPGPGQVLVRVRATSLNYRDQLVAAGTYFGGPAGRDLIPLSDGAGEVAGIGAGVTRFKVGDRVVGTFFQRTPEGPPAALGSPLDGMLAEQVVLYEDGLVPVPSGLTNEEAACLPCAGVTAWHALFRAGRPLKAGETVLVLGTGGVSIFALQFAHAAGARVVATSSSDDKLERVLTIGASDAINYRRNPDWDKEVMRITGGRGVDCVVEVGGGGTFARSVGALAHGGKVCLVGFVAGREGDTSPFPLMFKAGSLHGIFVGDREMFEEMNRAIGVTHVKPVVDRVFPFDEALAAFTHHASGKFVGKVVINLS
ncbi:MAG TPA: NAD(P)-dependent alcohol dehydrogenase [Vicinamibacterales bacterium]|nr:NAD(P)-dependent alcohol dehydrogenase [Vicinamibacterales bacterium]